MISLIIKLESLICNAEKSLKIFPNCRFFLISIPLILLFPLYNSRYCVTIGFVWFLLRFKLAIYLDKLIIKSWKTLFVIFGFSIMLLIFNNNSLISETEGLLIIARFLSS